MRHITAAVVLMIMAASASASDLKTYKAIYDKELETIVLAHGMQMTELGRGYANALEGLLVKVRRAGDLDKTTAVMNEIARFVKEKGVPEKPSALLDIQRFQSHYIKQAAAHDAQKAQKVVVLTSKYDGVLDRLQRELVSAGNLDEAMAIKEERDRVAGSEIVSAAKKTVMSAVTASPSTKITSTKKASGAATKGKKLEITVRSDQGTDYGKIVKKGEYWTDKDHGRGTIKLTFKDLRLGKIKPKSAVLKMHGGAQENADSKAHVAIMCGNARVGTYRGIWRNRWNETSLDVAGLKLSMGTLVLDLSQTSTDGSAFMSRATGKGAVLEVTY